MTAKGKRSSVDWEKIMRDPAVTEVTTMSLPNSAEKHDEKTDARLLRNLRSRTPRLKHLLGLSMAEVNGGK